MNLELSRRDQILKLIIDLFVKTGQPVGSHTLIEEYNLPYSSATIRNEMNVLEQIGYLEKTHTSSGRVPSSAGYRYYIENLREEGVDEKIKHQLTTLLNEKSRSVEEVISESCQILSHMTNLASVVLGPNAEEEHLVSIQMIPISQNTATAVFVTDQGYVENKTFIIDSSMSIKEIEECIKILNDRLKGTSVAHLIEKMEAIKPIIQDYVTQNDLIYKIFMEAFVKFAQDRISLYGKGELLDQPEFTNDATKLKKLFKLLEQPEIFIDSFDNNNEQISINIGELGEDYDDVSVITSKVTIPGHNEGTIAIVGPKRMDYNSVINALQYVARELERYFSKERDNDGKE